MKPIVFGINREFDEEGLIKFIFNVCDEHHREGKALAFAFIVYDFQDDTIVKVLKDHDYWSTLDKIAGKYLTVFYVDSRDSHFKARQNEIHYEQIRKSPKVANGKFMHHLHPIILKKTPLEKTVDFMKKEFGINETVQHPFIIFFQIKENEIIDSFCIKLKKDKLEEAFLELKNGIEYAVDSIKKVTPEHYENYQEVFNLIKRGVKDGKFSQFIVTHFIKAVEIGTIITLVKYISGLL